MLLRRFEMPWRETFEAYSALVWMLACIGLAVGWKLAPLPKLPVLILGCLSLGFLLYNITKAWEIWEIKWALGGKGIEFVDGGEIDDLVHLKEDALWVGWGFDWTPVHTQRLYEIKRADPSAFYPPRVVMWVQETMTGQKVGANASDVIGAPWIHGVSPDEDDLFVLVSAFVGNTLITGTTRCGKTRFLELIAKMAISLGYCVIAIDPKGDQPYEQTIIDACKAASRQPDYSRFHLAFPSSSIRVDPLKNYTNPADLASRIAALMPGGDKSSSFRDFAWGVLNAIVLGMLYIGQKPSLVGIRSYVDNGVADLLIRVILKFYDETLPDDWESKVLVFAAQFAQKKGKRNEDEQPVVRQSLNLLLSYYHAYVVHRGLRQEAIEALATIYKHDSAHYSKMIANLVPILGMLTTGELGSLLSPNPKDIDDKRPMTDLASLIKSNAVVYLGLDSLANKTVSSAVGSMLLSDLTSVAAGFYNFGGQHKVFVLVDEAVEVVNEPYIALLNKSAGAGFINVAAIQTIPDLAARFGSMDMARQMLGNFNNLFSFRVKDRVTQDFVTETFGQTYVHTAQVFKATSSNTKEAITNFSGTITERVSESLEDLVPADVLGQLPNWQYFGAVAGGRIIKGRLPIMTH